MSDLGAAATGEVVCRDCAVPLSTDNKDCVWHGYRSLQFLLEAEGCPANVRALAKTVETRAMAHALEFVCNNAIDGVILRARNPMLEYTADQALTDLQTSVRQLIAELRSQS